MRTVSEWSLGLLFLALIVVTLTGCKRIDAEKEILALKSPVAFVDQYQSLMSLTEIAAILHMPVSRVRDLVQPIANRKRLSKSHLKRQWFEVTKPDALLGFSGKVRFELYEDRLARIVFFPEDIDGFLSKGLRIKVATDGVVPTSIPSLRIATGPQHVVWMDVRIMSIEEELD